MVRLKFLLGLLLCAATSYASTTITVPVSTYVGQAPRGAQLIITLQGCQSPRIIGSAFLPLYPVPLDASSGNVTTTVYDNSQILCLQGDGSQQKSSYYSFSVLYQGSTTQLGAFQLSAGTYSLTQLTPCLNGKCVNPVPPTADNTYLRLDAGNVGSAQDLITILTGSLIGGVKDARSYPGVDIIAQAQAAYNSCGQTVSEIPKTCYVRVSGRQDGACDVATTTLTIPAAPYINPVLDFTGSKICHSGTNGLINFAGSGAPSVNPLIVGLNVVFTGTEPYLFRSDAFANLKIRDWTTKMYPANPTTQTVLIDFVGGNQFEVSHSTLQGGYDGIKFDQGSDSYGPNAVMVFNNTFSQSHSAINGVYMGAGITIHDNIFQGYCTGSCTNYLAGFFDHAIGLVFEANYIELGGPGGSVGHAIGIGKDAQGTQIIANNFADPSMFHAEIYDDSQRFAKYERNYAVGNATAFIDFGPDTVTPPTFVANNVAYGKLVGDNPNSLTYLNINNVAPDNLDPTTKSYLGGAAIFPVSGQPFGANGIGTSRLIAPDTNGVILQANGNFNGKCFSGMGRNGVIMSAQDCNTGEYQAKSFSTSQGSATGTTCTVGGYFTLTVDGTSRKIAYCN